VRRGENQLPEELCQIVPSQLVWPLLLPPLLALLHPTRICRLKSSLESQERSMTYPPTHHLVSSSSSSSSSSSNSSSGSLWVGLCSSSRHGGGPY